MAAGRRAPDRLHGRDLRPPRNATKSREAWPGAGSAQHADDAAGLLEALGSRPRRRVRGQLRWDPGPAAGAPTPGARPASARLEPGYFRQVPGGEQLQRQTTEAVVDHLVAHPDDWIGAWSAFRVAAQRALAATPSQHAPRRADPVPPPGATSGTRSARPPMPKPSWSMTSPILTRELVDEAALARLRSTSGSRTGPPRCRSSKRSRRTSPPFADHAGRHRRCRPPADVRLRRRGGLHPGPRGST